MDLFELAAQFRAHLMAGEAQAAARLTAVYVAMYEQMRPELEQVIAEIAAFGNDPSRLFESARLEAVLEHVAEHLSEYSGHAERLITSRQLAVAMQAQANVRQLVRAQIAAPAGFSGPTWQTVPARTLEQLAGFTAPGTPLSDVLETIVPHGVERVKHAMLVGTGMGHSPEEVGESVREALGSNLGRFLTVQRTAEMQAYREASRLSFEENDDLIVGWRWLASLSFDTCLACLAQHGTLHPISERMESHWNCRCVAVPETKEFSELGEGGEEVRPDWETGEAWLQRQTEENQRRTMGPSKFEAWKAGEVQLDDFTEKSKDPTWGNVRQEASLKVAKERATANKVLVDAPAKTLESPRGYRPARHFAEDASDFGGSFLADVAEKINQPPSFDVGRVQIYRIAEAQGFTALPEVIPHAEWMARSEAAFAKGDPLAGPYFRGLQEDKLAGVKAQVVGKADPVKAAQEFLSGKYYAGTYTLPGQPSGIYFAQNIVVAELFSQGENGQLLKALPHPNARLAFYKDIQRKAGSVETALRTRIERELQKGVTPESARIKGLQSLAASTSDVGYLTLILGYDGLIMDDQKYGKLITIYNRSALILSDNTKKFSS